MLALGIDIGTSGVRTAVLDQDGNLISMAKAPHLPQPNTNLDANLWWGTRSKTVCKRRPRLWKARRGPWHMSNASRWMEPLARWF